MENYFKRRRRDQEIDKETEMKIRPALPAIHFIPKHTPCNSVSLLDDITKNELHIMDTVAHNACMKSNTLLYCIYYFTQVVWLVFQHHTTRGFLTAMCNLTEKR